ncbi:hypothetical protein BGZ91_010434 [Linnemannia elongata]|nr:hypothetical protein BGZ91_010434 [Linnemannia elongata]
MESFTTSVMSPQDPMNKFNNNSTSSGMASSAHGPAPYAPHNSHSTAFSHQPFPGNSNTVFVGSGGQAQTVASFQSSSMRGEQQLNNNNAHGSPTTTSPAQQQQHKQNHPHSPHGATSPVESAQQTPYHPQKQQQNIPRPLQQNQQPQPSQPHQQRPIPEHHHIQYPSYKDPSSLPYPLSNGHANGTDMQNKANSNSNGMVRSHTHSLSHPHLQFAPYQEQNQKQQYQQPQQQHFNGFQQFRPQSPFRPPGSHIPHSMSMPMKPPTPTRMHLQFGPGTGVGAPSYDRRGSLGSGGYHLLHHDMMDTAMDSDGSSDRDSGDEGFGSGGGGVIQGAQWTRQECDGYAWVGEGSRWFESKK